jgi:hypothetical protein
MTQERVYGIGKPREISHRKGGHRPENSIRKERQSRVRSTNIAKENVIRGCSLGHFHNGTPGQEDAS